jgi:hypothetical protein
MIEFADGQGLDSSGPLRVEEHEGQWYVLGDGLILPAENEADAWGSLNCIQSQGVFMNMKVFKSPGARARAKAVLAAEGLEIQGADAVSISAFAHQSELPQEVAEEFVALEKSSDRRLGAAKAATAAAGAKPSPKA